ncbi:unnamed protein product, partial [Taenia asiatica]|uniref:Uncharacterized protein n=1 Tax=Taenia asiatica TaxID=60517 RepID=A0A0R3WHH6_TAEAS
MFRCREDDDRGRPPTPLLFFWLQYDEEVEWVEEEQQQEQREENEKDEEDEEEKEEEDAEGERRAAW